MAKQDNLKQMLLSAFDIDEKMADDLIAGINYPDGKVQAWDINGSPVILTIKKSAYKRITNIN